MLGRKISMLFRQKGQEQKIIWIFLTFILLYYLRVGIILSPDSGSYINYSIYRIGLYPLTISAFQYIFKDYALHALVGFQLISALSVSYVLAAFLRSLFNLPFLLYLALLGIFLFPLIFLKSGNDILSEGLAYPLFLLTTYFFLKGLTQKNVKDLYFFSFVLFLLAFTRQQYLFFYVVSFMAFLFFLFFQKSFQHKGKFFISIILSLGIFFISERSYHLIYHGSFSGTPFAGVQFIVRPLFLATEESYKAFDNPKQRQFVKEAVEKIIQEKIVDPNPKKRSSESFNLHYNTMFHRVLGPLWMKIWPQESFPNSDYYHMIDQQAISISFNLIKNNFTNYAKSYIKDVIRGFGGYTFFGFILFMCFLCCWTIFWHHRNDGFSLVFIFTNLIHSGNLFLVCLFEPPIPRYIYSTKYLLFSMLLIMGYLFTQKNPGSPCVE